MLETSADQPLTRWNASNDNVPYSLLRPDWQNAPAYEVIAKYNLRERAG